MTPLMAAKAYAQIQAMNARIEQIQQEAAQARRQGAMSGDGFGRPSRQAWQVKLLRLKPGYRRLSEHDGSGRQAAWRQQSSECMQSRS